MHWLVRYMLPQVVVTSRAQECPSALLEGRVLSSTTLSLTRFHSGESEGVCVSECVCVCEEFRHSHHGCHHGMTYPRAGFCLIPSSRWNDMQVIRRGVRKERETSKSHRCLPAQHGIAMSLYNNVLWLFFYFYFIFCINALEFNGPASVTHQQWLKIFWLLPIPGGVCSS